MKGGFTSEKRGHSEHTGSTFLLGCYKQICRSDELTADVLFSF